MDINGRVYFMRVTNARRPTTPLYGNSAIDIAWQLVQHAMKHDVELGQYQDIAYMAHPSKRKTGREGEGANIVVRELSPELMAALAAHMCGTKPQHVTYYTHEDFPTCMRELARRGYHQHQLNSMQSHRDALVVGAFAEGASKRLIADLSGMTESRIGQIIANEA